MQSVRLSRLKILGKKTCILALVLSSLLLGQKLVISVRSKPTLTSQPTFGMDILASSGLLLPDPTLKIVVHQANLIAFAFCTDFLGNSSSELYILISGSSDSYEKSDLVNDMQLDVQGITNGKTFLTAGQDIFEQVHPHQQNLSQNGKIEFQGAFGLRLADFFDEVANYFLGMNNVSTFHNCSLFIQGYLGFAGTLYGCVQESYSYRSLPLIVRSSGNVLSLGLTVVLASDCILREFKLNDLEITDPSMRTVSAKEELEPKQLWIGQCTVQWEIHDWTKDIPWVYVIPLTLATAVSIVVSMIEKRIHILSKVWKNYLRRRRTSLFSVCFDLSISMPLYLSNLSRSHL
jgi:hypothetical protein